MNGKGSRPRNNWSKQFRKNYDGIKWKKKKKELRRNLLQKLYYRNLIHIYE